MKIQNIVFGLCFVWIGEKKIPAFRKNLIIVCFGRIHDIKLILSYREENSPLEILQIAVIRGIVFELFAKKLFVY